MDNSNQQPQAQEVHGQMPSINSDSSKSKVIPIILGIAAAIAIAIGAFALGSKQNSTPTPYPTANWKTYTNSEHKFSVMYPPEWIINSQNKEITILASLDGKENLQSNKNAKFPEYYIRISLITRKNINNSLEKELQSTYTESPQCMGGECPKVAPTITQKTNQNSVKYYLITTGVYYNQVAVFPFSNDPTKYIELNPRRFPLMSNSKIPDQILSTFQFTSP